MGLVLAGVCKLQVREGGANGSNEADKSHDAWNSRSRNHKGSYVPTDMTSRLHICAKKNDTEKYWFVYWKVGFPYPTFQYFPSHFPVVGRALA